MILLQVAVGELELNHEYNSMHWSPEDFESKLQVAALCSVILSFPHLNHLRQMAFVESVSTIVNRQRWSKLIVDKKFVPQKIKVKKLNRQIW